MSHIIDGYASESEISSFIGGNPVVAAYAKNKDNPNEYYYEYWSSIKHPETGERLQAVKGYCNPNDFNQCYYAEYRDAEGNSYHYLDSRYYHDPELCGNKSISQQQSEDAAEWKENFLLESTKNSLRNHRAKTHQKQVKNIRLFLKKQMVLTKVFLVQKSHLMTNQMLMEILIVNHDDC